MRTKVLLHNRDFKKFRSLAKKNQHKKIKTRRVILLENRKYTFDFIGLLAFLPTAVRQYNANVVVYEMFPSNLLKQFKDKIRHRFSIIFSVAPSKLISITSQDKFLPKYQEIITDLTSKKTTKKIFENYHYRGILLGDLIYDFYIRKTKNLTLDFEDKRLKQIIFHYLQYTDKFLEYFESHEVKAVVVSHPVYSFAIPARIALHRNVEAFLVDSVEAIRFTTTNLHSYLNPLINLQEKFNLLTQSSKVHGKLIAKDMLDSRSHGDISAPRIWGPTKPDSKKYLNQLRASLSNVDSPKVLIALHDFNDAVHSYGNAFYPDFFEWLVAVGEITQGSKLEFLVKPHPYSITGESGILEQLKSICKAYPHFTLIPSSTSHYDIKNLGVKYCLTVHGSIAHEISALGLIVINASLNNPHKNYNFCITPTSLEDFQKMIKNIELINLDVDLDSIYEYYFMRFVYNLNSWTTPNLQEFFEEMKKFSGYDNKKTLSWYFRSNNKIELPCLKNASKNFIISNDSYLERKHFFDTTNDHGSSCQCESIRTCNGIIAFSKNSNF